MASAGEPRAAARGAAAPPCPGEPVPAAPRPEAPASPRGFAVEGRKLKVAQRYFAAPGIDYRHLSPKVVQYWQPSAPPATSRPGLSLVQPGEKPRVGQVAVPVYSLRVAAGLLSAGQAPEEERCVHLPGRVARLPGLFVAQVIGDSMDRVAAPRRRRVVLLRPDRLRITRCQGSGSLIASRSAELIALSSLVSLP